MIDFYQDQVRHKHIKSSNEKETSLLLQ